MGRKPLGKPKESTPQVLKGTRGVMAELLVTVLLGAYRASEPRVQRNQVSIIGAKVNDVNSFDRSDKVELSFRPTAGKRPTGDPAKV
jgi:hypothetical protein